MKSFLNVHSPQKEHDSGATELSSCGGGGGRQRERQVGRLQAAKYNQVLKVLGFIHPLIRQPQFFSSASHSCLFNYPF